MAKVQFDVPFNKVKTTSKEIEADISLGRSDEVQVKFYELIRSPKVGS